MSKLEQLIKKYCPDGVEYSTVGEVIGVNRGKRLTKSQLSDDGLYTVYHGSKDAPLGYYSSSNVKGPATIVVNTGGIGGVKYCEDDFWCSDGSFWLGHSEKMNDKFVYYWVSQFESWFVTQKRIGGVPTIDRETVSDVEIPVPPLPVQEEIVRILDSFTELETELETELKMRKKQYEYYRDKMLSLEDYEGEVENCTLGDIAYYPKDRIDASELNEDNYVGVDNMLQQKLGIKKSEAVPVEGRWSKYIPEDTLIGNIRPYLRKIWMADKEGGTNGDVVVLRTKDPMKLYPRYLYHICASERFFEYDNNTAKGAKMPRGNKETIPLFELVIPKDINEQIRIASVLDKFDELTANISEGLPAEIEMRHKQYEYYRDKLLTFDRLEGDAV